MKLPRVSTKSLDLSRAPKTVELMAAGQLGGLLFPTADISTEELKGSAVSAERRTQVEKNKRINLSFGQAIEKWNRHQYKDAVKFFKKHVEDFPDSPWAAESILHIGCDARYTGRYTDAEKSYNWIINNYQKKQHSGARRLVNKARKRLGVLRFLQNDFDAAVAEFAKLKAESPDWRHRVYASAWIQKLSRLKKDRLAALTCGAQALAALFEAEGNAPAARETLSRLPEFDFGHSIKDLASIATEYGYHLTSRRLDVSELDLLRLPAIVHLPSHGHGTGHYWVLERVDGDVLRLYDPQGKKRFNHTFEEFAQEWDGIAMHFADGVAGPGELLTLEKLDLFRGGCCGKEAPPGDGGNPGGNGGGGGGGPGCGSPAWDVNMINMNLYVHDVPLWYSTPIGPGVEISLSYNSQSSLVNHDPFGNKWQFNYASYLMADPGGNVHLVMPDGKEDIYVPDGTGGYSSPYKVYNTLNKLADNHFELVFPDDTVYEYDIPPGTGSLQSFLVSIRDAYGQAVSFGYSLDAELTTITDAMGQTSTLTYEDGLVTQVDDPFGRSALFEYDGNRNLVAITDMGGYRSTLSYDADIYLSSIGNPLGTYEFYVEPADGIFANADNYNPPGDDMWENYRITVTNPEGGKEEYFFYGGTDASGEAYSWYISPNHYIPWKNNQINNYRINTPRTRYDFNYIASGDRGEIAKITYPEGRSVSYTYDLATGLRIGETDSLGNTTSYTYNQQGQLLTITDPKGQTVTNTYDINGFDLLSYTDSDGTVTMTYNPEHEVTSIEDRKGMVTTYVHDLYGRVTTKTEDVGGIERVTTNVYDSTSYNLSEVQRDGVVVEQYTYDGIGRVATKKESTGLLLEYGYNDLNYITSTLWPDGKTETVSYVSCCTNLRDSVTDRAGRTTTYNYDALKRLISEKNGAGVVTRYEYDANGNRTAIVYPQGNVTRFEYDAEDRVIRKVFSDGTVIRYRYDTEGNLVQREDPRGIVSRMSYDPHGNLLTEYHSDGTATVENVYDASNRIIERHDGLGTTLFSYDENSNLISVDGPWDSDTITYGYDALDRLTSESVDGSPGVSKAYDSLDRLLELQVGTDIYSYGYSGANPNILGLTRPNGSTTEYGYDGLNRLLELINRDSTGAVISQHTYTYNEQGGRASEAVSRSLGTAGGGELAIESSYNNLNQLTASTDATSYSYDAAGNTFKGYTAEGFEFEAEYDAVNRLTSISYTDGNGDLKASTFQYFGDGMLAVIQHFLNGSQVGEIRIVRYGLVPLQDRDATNTILRAYVLGPDKGGGIGGMLQMHQQGADYHYIYDGKGNVSGLLDNNEIEVASYLYGPFGKLVGVSENIEQPLRFSTKRYDKFSGLVYFGHRFYLPAIGRWLNRDYLAESMGANMYLFANADPINAIDPNGLWINDGTMTIYPQVGGGEPVTISVPPSVPVYVGDGRFLTTLGGPPAGTTDKLETIVIRDPKPGKPNSGVYKFKDGTGTTWTIGGAPSEAWAREQVRRSQINDFLNPPDRPVILPWLKDQIRKKIKNNGNSCGGGNYINTPTVGIGVRG